jgi:hypothetical protein
MICNRLHFRLLILVISAVLAWPTWAEEKLELEETEITGARELPKVLYIVPWRRTQPDPRPLPMRSLVDEALEPVEMDVFQRQVRYHQFMESAKEQNTQ